MEYQINSFFLFICFHFQGRSIYSRSCFCKNHADRPPQQTWHPVLCRLKFSHLPRFFSLFSALTKMHNNNCEVSTFRSSFLMRSLIWNTFVNLSIYLGRNASVSAWLDLPLTLRKVAHLWKHSPAEDAQRTVTRSMAHDRRNLAQFISIYSKKKICDSEISFYTM